MSTDKTLGEPVSRDNTDTVLGSRISRITISDVAREAGVSTQTVSRVINDRPDVSEQTRRHVERIIDRLGYRPNASARSLSSRRSRTLGVVAAKLDSYGPATTLHGVEAEADRLGYSLLLELITEDFTQHEGSDVLAELISLQVDGIVWMVHSTTNNRRWLESNPGFFDVPVVFVDARRESSLPFVASDGQFGGRLAARHFVECGYSRIGIITGPLSWASAVQRLEGWQEITGSRNRDLVYEGDWTASSGERGIAALIEKTPDLDAVFACNDQMALGVLHYLHGVGKRVPEEIGVIGYDATPESEYFWPPLTTIAQPLEEQGAAAVSHLHRILDTSRERSHPPSEQVAEWLKPSLIVRNTTRSVDRQDRHE